MAKKEEVEEVKVEVINPLTVSFGREDLDSVVAKLNEIIAKLNG